MLLQVFEALMLWLLKEPDKRKKQLPSLLTKVRLPLMTPQTLADVVAQDTLVKTSLKCRSKFMSFIQILSFNLVILMCP